MSDYNSSLPVRTENNGDVAIRVVDGTITSQQLTVNADGSINITDNGGIITVDGTVELGATTLAALESITVQNGAGASAVNIQDGGNSITVDAVDLDIRDLVFATDKVDVSGSSVTVTATDLDIRDLSHTLDSVKIGDGADFLAVNTDGSINVVITDASPGTAINDYNTVSSVAAAATSNHDYTSVGNFYLNQIHASGSGKIKIEVLVDAVSKFVCFNSTANPNIDITIANPILATSGQVVRIIRTNKDNQSQDVYSTISGYNS